MAGHEIPIVVPSYHVKRIAAAAAAEALRAVRERIVVPDHALDIIDQALRELAGGDERPHQDEPAKPEVGPMQDAESLSGVQTLGSSGLAPCVWHQDDVGGSSVWETGCGNAFEFNDGGPIENRAAFCCYCGKPLRESRTSGDERPQPSAPVAADLYEKYQQLLHDFTVMSAAHDGERKAWAHEKQQIENDRAHLSLEALGLKIRLKAEIWNIAHTEYDPIKVEVVDDLLEALISAVRAESAPPPLVIDRREAADDRVGLIGQTIPDAAETEPRLNSAALAACACGNGWTFDFANRRVYCRKCDSSAVENSR